MVGEKAFKSKLLIYVCAIIIVIMSMPIHAYAVSAVPEEYTGSFRLVGGNTYLTLKAYGTSVGTGDEVDEIISYSGSATNRLEFRQQEGKIYNGQVEIAISYELTHSSVVNVTLSRISHSVLNVESPDSIIVSSFIQRHGVDTITVVYDLIFENYVATYTGALYIGITDNYDLGIKTTAGLNEYNGYLYLQTITSNPLEWAGNFQVYNYLGDVDGYGGTIVDQNDQIIVEQQQQNQLQEEANQMQEEGNALQEEANTLQEEANATSKNIFDKITDFFDNFFTRLGDFLLGLIVPSSDDLTAFLNEVNDWFSERLGFIWYPFSFAVDSVSALAGGTADTGITVPALTLNMFGGTYTIWNEMQVDLDAFGIFRYVRLFTSFICVGGIVALAYNKWDEWIGGHGVG